MRYFAYALLSCLLTARPVLAHCDLSTFDSTPPAAIRGDVDTSSGKFSWASDFDRQGGFEWVRNYISNTSLESDLNVDWPKASLRQAFVRPLPAGETFCAEYPVMGLTDNDIDDDAPIVYGPTNVQQRAAVYAKKTIAEEASHRYVSNLSSSYRNKSGEIEPVDVSVTYSVKDGIISDMAILSDSDVYVSIDAVGDLWSDTTLSSLKAAAEQQGSGWDLGALTSFTKEEAGLAFLKALSPKSEQAVLVKGSVKGFAIGEKTTASKLAQVVVFNSEREPVLASYVSLPVTNPKQ